MASAYLDGRVLHDARTRMDAHLASCAGCRAYVNQIEIVRKTLKWLPGPIMESARLDRLRKAFLFATMKKRGRMREELP